MITTYLGQFKQKYIIYQETYYIIQYKRFCLVGCVEKVFKEIETKMCNR